MWTFLLEHDVEVHSTVQQVADWQHESGKLYLAMREIPNTNTQTDTAKRIHTRTAGKLWYRDALNHSQIPLCGRREWAEV